MLSTGILLPNGPGIADPSDKKAKPFEDLTVQVFSFNSQLALLFLEFEYSFFTAM